ncbi:MAG: hypothetical protein ACXVEF_32330, partial [Polyangiales bacterium]
MALAPCPSCRRHVDVASENCPFCGTACVGLEPRLAPRARMTRQALALASSMAIVGSGCGDDTSYSALYGAPTDTSPVEVQGDDGLAFDSASTDSGSAGDSTTSTDSGTDSGTTEDSG